MNRRIAEVESEEDRCSSCGTGFYDGRSVTARCEYCYHQRYAVPCENCKEGEVEYRVRTVGPGDTETSRRCDTCGYELPIPEKSRESGRGCVWTIGISIGLLLLSLAC